MKSVQAVVNALIILIVLTTACTSASGPALTTPVVPVTTLPPDLVEPTPFCECFWRADIKAWLDVNRNGKMDTGEAPVSHVPFYLVDGQAVTLDETITDEKGEAQLGYARNFGNTRCNCDLIEESFTVTYKSEQYVLVSQKQEPSETSQRLFWFGFAAVPQQ